MAMPEHHHARPRKLLPCHLHPIMRIPQDMHNPDTTLPDHNLALDRQFHSHLVLFNIALYRHYRCDRLQLIQNRKNGEIPRMNNQFDPIEMLPRSETPAVPPSPDYAHPPGYAQSRYDTARPQSRA